MKTMRTIFAATLVALLSSAGASAQAISSLPAASTVGATDVFVGVQSGTTKKFPFSVIEAGISVSGVEDGDKGDITVASSGLAWSIDAGAITEAMLKCVNAPTDEYMLTYEATTGDYEWQAPFSAANVPAAETDSAHDTAAEVGAVALQGSTPGTAQTGNSNISGTAVAGTAVISPSVVGGTSGSSTLTLDGDSAATGNVTVSGAGNVSASGGFTARTDQLGGGAILLSIGGAGTGNMTGCAGACTWAGMATAAVVLNASDLGFYTSSSGVAWEGTDDAHETRLVATDPTADRTITLPNATGTVGTFVAAPAAATDACVAGQYAAATGFAYFCVSANTWERVPIATW